MKPVFSTILVWTALCLVQSRAYPRATPLPADFSRTLLVAKGDQIATAFLYVHDGQHYWVTARSFLKATPSDTIVVYYAGRPISVPIAVLSPLHPTDQVAVFEIPGMNIPAATPETPAVTLADTIQTAADGWALAYPLQLVADVLPNMMPKPFALRCSVAAINYDQMERPIAYYLDGQYHRGCAGAPIYAENSTGKLRLIGVALDPVQEQIGGDPKLQINTGIFQAAPIAIVEGIIEASHRR